MSKSESTVLAALAAGIASYPASLVLWNNSWREHVDPELRVLVGPYVQVEVELVSSDQLARVVSNCEQLNAVNQWSDGAGLHLLLPDDERVVRAEEPASTPPGGAANGEGGGGPGAPAPSPSPTAKPTAAKK